MQGLEQSKDINYVLELLQADTQSEIKKFIVEVLIRTSDFIQDLVTQIYDLQVAEREIELQENLTGFLYEM